MGAPARCTSARTNMATRMRQLSVIRLPRGSDTLELGSFKFKTTALVVQGTPTFDEWEHCGTVLRRIEGAVQFWIGDWLNYGEHAYGEKYAQAVNETQADTWKNYAWVSHQVKKSTRVDDLSWSHHREVAKFHDAPDIQRELLQQAAGLSVSEFRAVVRARVHG